jgi:hypothetical protein
MNNTRVTVSLALIVLICFFLPWVQLSCGASSNRLSGVDLARDGHTLLWLIPLFMLVILLGTFARVWQERTRISVLLNMIFVLLSAYLMNRERLRAQNTSGLDAVAVTGWFWLAFVSTIALIGLSAFSLLKRSKVSR